MVVYNQVKYVGKYIGTRGILQSFLRLESFAYMDVSVMLDK